jgi:hypothetical protein
MLQADTTDGIEKRGLAGCSSVSFGSIRGIAVFPEPVRASDGPDFPRRIPVPSNEPGERRACPPISGPQFSSEGRRQEAIGNPT